MDAEEENKEREEMHSCIRPYDAPIRPESIIDFDFTRTREEKIVAIMAMARAFNALGQTFKLKYNFSFMVARFEKFHIKYEMQPLEAITGGRVSNERTPFQKMRDQERANLKNQKNKSNKLHLK